MEIHYAIEDAIGRMVLSNPPYNALTTPVFESDERLRAFLATPGLKSVVLTGAGRHFCSGADLKALTSQLTDPAALEPLLHRGRALLQMIMFATVPVIAAIRGGCLGAGLEIALSCHFRIASGNALFGFPESRHGLMPALGGSVMSSGLISRRAAVDLILSGRMFDAGEAVEIGLVDVLASSGTVTDRAMSFARELVGDRSPEQIRAVMESIHNSVRMTREEALVRETELFIQIASGDRERT